MPCFLLQERQNNVTFPLIIAQTPDVINLNDKGTNCLTAIGDNENQQFKLSETTGGM